MHGTEAIGALGAGSDHSALGACGLLKIFAMYLNHHLQEGACSGCGLLPDASSEGLLQIPPEKKPSKNSVSFLVTLASWKTALVLAI